MPGLGLLEVFTVMDARKQLGLVQAEHVGSGLAVAGYEIHLGRSAGADCARPFARIAGRPEGAVSEDGLVMGSYLHGLFQADAFRAAFLRGLGAQVTLRDHGAAVEAALDGLAEHLEAHLDVPGLLGLAGT